MAARSDEGAGWRPPPPLPPGNRVPPPPPAPSNREVGAPEADAPGTAAETDAAETRTQTRWLLAVSGVALLLVLAAALMLVGKRGSEGASSGIYQGEGAGEAAGTGSDGGGGENGSAGSEPAPDPEPHLGAAAASGEPDGGSEQQAGSPEESPAPLIAQDAQAEQQPSLVLLERRAIPPRVVASGGQAGTGGAGAGGAATFFGVWDKGKRFVYVVDSSGSMSGAKIAAAKQELARSIGLLQPDRQFYVIFYSNTPNAPQPMRLWQATQQGKAFALQWVESVSAGGGTQPLEAVRLALQLGPDAVFLLSDGRFRLRIADQIRQANPSGRIRIHTLAFHDPSGEEVLKKIAEENNGVYRFVPGPGPYAPPGMGLRGFGRAP